MVHIINYVVNVKYDGDSDDDGNGNRNNIKWKGETQMDPLCYIKISNLINYRLLLLSNLWSVPCKWQLVKTPIRTRLVK